MGAPKAVVYCGKCGNSLIVGSLPETGPVRVAPCRFCIRKATQEGYVAGRTSAIAELYVEKPNDQNQV